MTGVIILSLLIFVIVDLFIFPVFMEVAHVGILHANPVMQHAYEFWRYWDKTPHFYTYFEYLQFALLAFSLVIIVIKWMQVRAIRRQNETDSDAFGGIRGSARWATEKEMRKYWVRSGK